MQLEITSRSDQSHSTKWRHFENYEFFSNQILISMTIDTLQTKRNIALQPMRKIPKAIASKFWNRLLYQIKKCLTTLSENSSLSNDFLSLLYQNTSLALLRSLSNMTIIKMSTFTFSISTALSTSKVCLKNSKRMRIRKWSWKRK